MGSLSPNFPQCHISATSALHPFSQSPPNLPQIFFIFYIINKIHHFNPVVFSRRRWRNLRLGGGGDLFFFQIAFAGKSKNHYLQCRRSCWSSPLSAAGEMRGDGRLGDRRFRSRSGHAPVDHGQRRRRSHDGVWIFRRVCCCGSGFYRTWFRQPNREFLSNLEQVWRWEKWVIFKPSTSGVGAVAGDVPPPAAPFSKPDLFAGKRNPNASIRHKTTAFQSPITISISDSAATEKAQLRNPRNPASRFGSKPGSIEENGGH